MARVKLVITKPGSTHAVGSTVDVLLEEAELLLKRGFAVPFSQYRPESAMLKRNLQVEASVSNGSRVKHSSGGGTAFANRNKNISPR